MTNMQDNSKERPLENVLRDFQEEKTKLKILNSDIKDFQEESEIFQEISDLKKKLKELKQEFEDNNEYMDLVEKRVSVKDRIGLLSEIIKVKIKEEQLTIFDGVEGIEFEGLVYKINENLKVTKKKA